jgi:integrase
MAPCLWLPTCVGAAHSRRGRRTLDGARVRADSLEAAGLDYQRPYDVRHSYGSLLLHGGRSVIYVARRLGHGAGLTMGTYGHVIDELEEPPRINAETAIRAAREHSVNPRRTQAAA